MEFYFIDTNLNINHTTKELLNLIDEFLELELEDQKKTLKEFTESIPRELIKDCVATKNILFMATLDVHFAKEIKLIMGNSKS